MKKTKTSKTNLSFKEYLIIAFCIIGSIILGIISNDLIIGTSLLAVSLISSYLSTIYRRSNYIFGAISAFLIAYTAYINNFFGSFAINAFIFIPLEIYGFVAWSRHLDSNKNVKARKFTFKNSVIVTSSCAIGSVILGYLLTLIPGQQLAFIDSTICCLDICALILFNLRFRECWWLWTLSGILSIIMWSVALASGGDNSLMRLITAVCFTVLSIYGIIKWNSKAKLNSKR